MSIFVVSPKHDVSLEKCCLHPNSIASFFQLILLKPLVFFGSWLRSFVTLAGFRSRPCISWSVSSLLFTCILLVRIHKLYQFVFLLRELYWRQGAPAANNLPDNFWKKLFRSHLWLRFGWLYVGSWKRSGKDCIFRIDQRVHPYVRLATASTSEKPDCGLFKDSLRLYVITCVSSVGNVFWKVVPYDYDSLWSVFHPIHLFRFAHRRAYSFTCDADHSGSCSLTLATTIYPAWSPQWITGVISLSLMQCVKEVELDPSTCYEAENNRCGSNNYAWFCYRQTPNPGTFCKPPRHWKIHHFQLCCYWTRKP